MGNLLKAIGLVVVPGAVPVAVAGLALVWMMEKRKDNNNLKGDNHG
tara:strand:- start:359 stop:496 length:138 start_codon:yes stop_codon:yes gene_type:complete